MPRAVLCRYKVTYFSMKALGEPIRFIFKYAGVGFVDDRVEMSQWPALKPTMPFGQIGHLGILEFDGKRVNQSTAICRYLAKQFGLAGNDDWENLEIDAAVDTIHDLRAKIFAYRFEKNADAKAQKLEVLKEVVPFYVERLDAQVKKNGEYLVGGRLTWADLFFVSLLDYLNYMAQRDIIENAENLKALRNKVLEQPRIKTWVEERPKSRQ